MLFTIYKVIENNFWLWLKTRLWAKLSLLLLYKGRNKTITWIQTIQKNINYKFPKSYLYNAASAINSISWNRFSQRLIKVADSAAASEICAFLKPEIMRSFDSFMNLNMSTIHLCINTSVQLLQHFFCLWTLIFAKKIAFGTLVNQNIKRLE